MESTRERSTRSSFHELHNSNIFKKSQFIGLFSTLVRTPLLLPERKDLLKDPSRNYHSLIQQNSLKLVVCAILGKTYRLREYQKVLQTLLLTPDEQIHLIITNRLGENGLVGAVDGKCAPLDVVRYVFDCLPEIFFSRSPIQRNWVERMSIIDFS